jgi:hypothetical protein
MHKLLLATGGLLLALLVLDGSNELLAQREGGAYWGAFSRGGLKRRLHVSLWLRAGIHPPPRRMRTADIGQSDEEETPNTLKGRGEGSGLPGKIVDSLGVAVASESFPCLWIINDEHSVLPFHGQRVLL